MSEHTERVKKWLERKSITPNVVPDIVPVRAVLEGLAHEGDITVGDIRALLKAQLAAPPPDVAGLIAEARSCHTRFFAASSPDISLQRELAYKLGDVAAALERVARERDDTQDERNDWKKLHELGKANGLARIANLQAQLDEARKRLESCQNSPQEGQK